MAKRDYSTEDFELVDLYVTYNRSEAQFLEDFLDDNDIANFVRDVDNTGSAFPMSMGDHNQYRIVVEDDKLQAAVDLIRQAIEDDAITDEGRFVYEDE